MSDYKSSLELQELLEQRVEVLWRIALNTKNVHALELQSKIDELREE